MSNPPALTPIVGVDTYISVADTDALAGKRIHASAWRAAIDKQNPEPVEGQAPALPFDMRPLALTTATAMLDNLNWNGTRTQDAQPLAWPRTRVRDARGYFLPSDAIPAGVATACAELAMYLFSSAPPSETPVQMRQLGDSLTMYFPSIADDIPRHVRRLVEPYLTAPSRYSAELVA